MMTARVLVTSLVIVTFFGALGRHTPAVTTDPALSVLEVDSIYRIISAGNVPIPDEAVFTRALTGYRQLAAELGSVKPVITIIDFTKPSSEKRLWVIDVEKGIVLHHTLVAHGRNSGELFAKEFSNTPSSLQSSLGFYLTGTTYVGKHGLSLKLRGVEPGINDQAEARAIVMHGADYVREDYVTRVGRLGRSWGCPAVPMDSHRKIIEQLAGGTWLFIYHDSPEYIASSRYF